MYNLPSYQNCYERIRPRLPEKTHIIAFFPLHQVLPSSLKWQFATWKQGGRSGCRSDTARYKIHKQIKHVEYFLHSWLHLLFDPIQCVSSSTWIHRTFCQISSNVSLATLKQTIPWNLHRIKSLFCLTYYYLLSCVPAPLPLSDVDKVQQNTCVTEDECMVNAMQLQY